MTLLDRYIVRLYIQNIAILLAIMSAFVLLVDITLNVDRFANAATKMDASATGLRHALLTIYLIADLWWPRLLQLMNYLTGIILVAGMGFTCAQMVRHRELVAVLGSGVSLWRVARPILLVAVGVILAQAASQELILPRIAPLLTRDAGEAGRRDLGALSVPLTADSQGRLLAARSFDADRGLLEGLYVLERGAKDTPDEKLAVRVLTADRAEWLGGAWQLSGVRVETRTPRADPTPVTRLVTDLDPTALKVRRFQGFMQNLSWRQIGQMLAAEERGGTRERARLRERLERIRLARISIAMANLLSLLMVLPSFLTRTPGNMLVQSLKTAPVGILALLGGVLGAWASIPALPTAISAFVPVLILAPIAAYRLGLVRT